MNLTKFPRRRYTSFNTPIEFLPKLTEHLGGPKIYIKRDDLLGLAGGGNKTRKLEFLIGDALSKGADTIITCGAVQSNHCRLTLAAASKEGLKCHLVIEERVPGSYSPDATGNNFLYNLIGADGIHVAEGGSNLLKKMESIAESLKVKGQKSYIIPGGGSSEVGALGYVSCAGETLQQLNEMGLDIDAIVTTSGSAGTHSGLLTGMVGQNADIPIVGICCNRRKDAQREAVFKLCQKTADKLGLRAGPVMEDVIVFDDYIGEGYSLPTPEMLEAVRLLVRLEAILLDNVYTGKAMSGLIDLVKKSYFKERFGAENILFLHTGGSPALYHYAGEFFAE